MIVASITAGAIIPEIFLILFFQRGRPNSRNFRNLLFTVPVWGFDGALVDLLYRSEAAWFGDVVTLPVVCAKICVDQFGYNPFFAAPFGVLTYEWKNNGISLGPLRQLFTLAHYRDKILPTLLATWAVWIPLMAIIYSLPLALQFPLFGLALSFWVLLLTYMTNRFAGKIEADAPLALATAEVESAVVAARCVDAFARNLAARRHSAVATTSRFNALTHFRSGNAEALRERRRRVAFGRRNRQPRGRRL